MNKLFTFLKISLCVALFYVQQLNAQTLTATISGTDVMCNGDADGTATVTATGGATPYSYLWSSGHAVSSVVGLTAGSYMVSVTDMVQTMVVDSIIINEPPPMTITLLPTDATCNGQANGLIDAVITGGVAPYTYTWSDGSIMEDLFAVPVGAYTLTVTDVNGCTVSSSALVNEPTAIAVTQTISNASCSGSSDGAVDITVTGGAAPYTYTWSSGATTEDLFNVGVGAYTVNITDGNGCIQIDSANVSEPAPITVNTGPDQTVCEGTPFAINATVSGAMGGTWTTSGTGSIDSLNSLSTMYTPSAIDISMGSVILTFTATAGSCTAQDDVMFMIDPQPTVNAGPDVSVCNGDQVSLAGSVIGAVGGSWTSGGVGVLTSPGSLTTDYIPMGHDTIASSILMTLTSTGNGSCAASSDDLVITVHNAPIVSAAITNESSAMACDGQVILTVTGGIPTYSYVWSNGSTSSVDSSLCGGNNSITVTDGMGCIRTHTLFVPTDSTPPCNLVTTSTLTNETAPQACDGSALLSTIGGVAPYNYQWSNSSNGMIDSMLCGGSYTVTVTDFNSCSEIHNFIILTDSAQPCSIMTSATIMNETSLQACDGSATLNTVGGTAPYTYQWSNGNTAASDSMLCGGVYTVTVMDFNGCIEFYNFTVLTDTTAQCNLITTSTITNETGAGLCDGSATLTTTGGAAPYSYAWPNGSSSNMSSTLCGGTHVVTVTDAGNCVELYTLFVATDSVQCTPINLSNSIDICQGDSVLIGGIYQSNAGTYVDSLVTSSGCDSIISTTLVIAAPLVITPSTQDAMGNGVCDGSANISVSGGSGTYVFNWSNGSALASDSALCAGSYTITVTDSMGCFASTVISIGEPSAIASSATSTDANCNGVCDGTAQITATGGLPPYSYFWSNGMTGDTPTGMCSGMHNYTITDAGSGVATGMVEINEPTAIVVVATSTNANCGQSDGSASVSAQGGTGSLSFLWYDGSTQSSISNVSSGSYSVAAIDDNGCEATTLALIGDSDGPTVSIVSSVDANCGGADGEVYIDVVGGTTPYSYIWSDSTAHKNNLNAASGDNTVLVEDVNGCAGTATTTVGQQGTNPPRITGKVTSSLNGFSVTAGTVKIYSDNPYQNALEVIASTPIDAFGNYTFNSILPIGNYILIAEADTNIGLFQNIIPTYYGFTHIWDSASTVGVQCDSVYTADIVVRDLTPLDGTSDLGGFVGWDGTNPKGGRAGEPIPGIGISLQQIPGGIVAFTTTDDNGDFVFSNVPISDSSYTIYVDLPGLPMEESYNVDVTSDTSVTDLDFLAGDSTVYIPDAVSSVQHVSIEQSSMMRVYPNPFNETTNIFYRLETTSPVSLSVYNVIGEEVYTESYSNRLPGSYQTRISSKDFDNTSGIYIVKLAIGSEIHTTRLIEVK